MRNIKWLDIGEWDQPLLFTGIEAEFAQSRYCCLLVPNMPGDYKVKSRHFFLDYRVMPILKRRVKEKGFLPRYIRSHRKFITGLKQHIKKYSDVKIVDRQQALKLLGIFIDEAREYPSLWTPVCT